MGCGRQESGQAPYSSPMMVTIILKSKRIPVLYSDGGHIDNLTLTSGNEINEPYLDGVSITHGTPREHILWDGSAQCPRHSTCCAPLLGPWFHSVLNRPSANDIEVRICGNESIYQQREHSTGAD